MKQFKSAMEILEFAISEEEAAAKFYKALAGKVEKQWMKKAFLDFAREEEGHKAKLQRIQKGELPELPNQKVLDLKIGDYLEDVKVSADMDYQQALIVAMKKEKAAFRMYSDLASVTQSGDLQAVLLSLAQEEAKHKLRFEVEYDEEILKEN